MSHVVSHRSYFSSFLNNNKTVLMPSKRLHITCFGLISGWSLNASQVKDIDRQQKVLVVRALFCCLKLFLCTFIVTSTLLVCGTILNRKSKETNNRRFRSPSPPWHGHRRQARARARTVVFQDRPQRHSYVVSRDTTVICCPYPCRSFR